LKGGCKSGWRDEQNPGRKKKLPRAFFAQLPHFPKNSNQQMESKTREKNKKADAFDKKKKPGVEQNVTPVPGPVKDDPSLG